MAESVRSLPATRFQQARRISKLSEAVALEIVHSIVSEGLNPGDTLPQEAEMLVRYGVSRSSLREALRLLEVQGLIVIRTGPGPNTVVGQVLPGNLARTLTLYLHMMGATYDQLLDAWIASEPLMARLAAQNPNRARVRELLSPFLATNHGPDGKWQRVEGIDFHERIAELANNPVLSLVLSSISFISTEHVMTTLERGELEDHMVHEHAALAEAIIAGEGGTAERLMAEHNHHCVEDFRAFWPLKVGEKVRWR